MIKLKMEITMYINTTPNKEVARRICVMNKASSCYILVDYSLHNIILFSDIPEILMKNTRNKLVSWGGMNFNIYNENSDSSIIDLIKTKGEMVLPVILR